MSEAEKNTRMAEIDRAFYKLVVKERDYERHRSQRVERERDALRAELIRAKVRLGEIGVGALLSSEAKG